MNHREEKPPKAFKLRGEEQADTSYWQSVDSGLRVASVSDLNLFNRRDFDRFKVWLEKAELWVCGERKYKAGP